MRRHVHFGKFLVCFALLLVMPLYQNCNGTRFDSDPTKSLSLSSSSGNGGVYEGKPTPGEYYRFVPGTKCDPQSSVHSKLNVTETAATLENYETADCRTERKDVPLSSIEASARNSKLVGFEGIYEMKASRPIAQPEEITEMWCRASRADGEVLDVVVRHKQADSTTSAEILSVTTSRNTRVSRNLRAGTLKYDSVDLALSIDIRNAGISLERLPGLMNVGSGGQTVTYELSCRSGGLLDKVQPILPTLALDFTAPVLPPSVQISRASLATYFDSNGILRTAGSHSPRFDHNSLTKEPRGLLVEKSSTNLFPYSTDFQNAYWQKSHAIVRMATEVAAPDGSFTAMKLIDTANLENHEITARYVLPATPATHYTCSFFVKGAERYSGMVFVFKEGTGNAFEINWNTSLRATRPHTLGTGVISSYEFTELQNGWFRVSVSGQVEPTPASGTIGCRLILGELRGNYYYTGDGTSGLYIWGAQLEAGAEPTSYIATNGATVTRAADSVVMTSLDWFNPSQGTFVISASRSWPAFQSGREPTLFSVSGASNSQVSLYMNSPVGVRALVSSASGAVADWQTGTTPTSGSGSELVGLGYAAGDVAAVMNGVLSRPGVNVNAFPFTPSVLSIGGSADQQKWNGPIKSILYWPAKLSDALLVDSTK